jgi:hypothetical protein
MPRLMHLAKTNTPRSHNQTHSLSSTRSLLANIQRTNAPTDSIPCHSPSAHSKDPNKAQTVATKEAGCGGVRGRH